MIDFIDNQLNRITMYRLVLYYLIFLLAAAVLMSFAGILRYNPYALLFSTGFLIAACWATNTLFSKAFGVPANAESLYISALILALIITPITSLNDLWFLAWAAVWAMASKYIVALNGKHIFNPVAFAVALTYLTLNQSASWWVGSAAMLPFVLVGGLLVVRKLKRWDLVGSFFLGTLAVIFASAVFGGADLFAELGNVIVLSPLFFFAFIILTEPLTAPVSLGWRVVYGALVGFLFAPEIHLGSFYATPEIAILAGNVLSYLVNPRARLVLSLKNRIRIAPDIYDFVFAPRGRFAFAPGQYMEWTLGMHDPDTRGNRRYFTLASSPTEGNVRVGVRFYPEASTFKQAMLAMPKDSAIIASQLAGDFVLPRNPKQKTVFIAGGIGITPFRSMLKYLLDVHEPRPITVFYATHSPEEIVYTDVLERARRELGIPTIYTVTDVDHVPTSWQGYVGRITPEMIRLYVPDFRKSVFYISGPKSMVDSFQALLRELHVPESHIKTDFFPGFA